MSPTDRNPKFAQWQNEAMLQPLSAYLGADRHYHDIGHVSDCLRQLTEMNQIYGDQIRYREELIVATIYHDCVYDPRAKDNESQSADAALAAYPNLNARVLRAIIMATLHTGEVLDSIEEKIMVDVDLFGLALEFNDFQASTEKIRREYSMFDDQEFRRGRCAFLSAMLKRPRIYSTALYFDRYEARARENLRRSLESFSQMTRNSPGHFQAQQG